MRQTKKTASIEFLVYEEKSWTYKEVYDIVLKYGTWLKTTYAIAPKEIVAMDFMNSPLFIFLWMGIWSIGATPAFINYNLTGDPLVHSVKSSAARILFVDPEVKTQFTREVVDTFASPKARDGKACRGGFLKPRVGGGNIECARRTRTRRIEKSQKARYRHPHIHQWHHWLTKTCSHELAEVSSTDRLHATMARYEEK